jgi:hypothetical protein
MTYQEYRIRHLQRFPLGTPYPEIARKVVDIMGSLGGGILAIDATGVGAAVVDLFWEAGLTPYAITITGGRTPTNKAEDEVKKKGGAYVSPSLRDVLSWTVPKRDLVGVLAVGLQNHIIRISGSLPDARTLTDELLNFKVKINEKTAHDSYEAWREGVHDDLVLSVAIGLWVAREFGGGEFFLGLDLGQASDYTALSITQGVQDISRPPPEPIPIQVPTLFEPEPEMNPIRKLRGWDIIDPTSDEIPGLM